MEKIIGEGEIETFRRRCAHLIDARSPKEFAEDHMPGARNIPVLDDAQREEIGTLHKSNPLAARKQGALYALDAAKNLVGSELVRQASRDTGFMIYCARGGQRSGALSVVLSQIGFPVFRLERGYKTYRAYIQMALARALPEPVFVLYGYTGSMKTLVLHALAASCNILDLEGCARHRGSILGDLPGIAQPGQRAFETATAAQIMSFDPAKPTLIEGESRNIGSCQIPEGLWRQMAAAKHLWLEIPREARVAHILQEYHELKDPQYLEDRLQRLARYLSRKLIQGLREDISCGNWPAFVEKLLEFHYDPLYGKALRHGGKYPVEAKGFEEAVAAVGRAVTSKSPAI